MILLILGVALGVATLSFINQSDLGGVVCYHFGMLSYTTRCIFPIFYYSALGIAAVLTVLGILRLIKANTARPSQ